MNSAVFATVSEIIYKILPHIFMAEIIFLVNVNFLPPFVDFELDYPGCLYQFF
jgi:hypothetical protein